MCAARSAAWERSTCIFPCRRSSACGASRNAEGVSRRTVCPTNLCHHGGRGATMRLMTLALLLATTTSAADIPKGAHALLRLVNSVSTRTAREGDYVYLRTETPIVDGGAILVPVDSYVQGVVTQSRRSGRVKGVAELGIRIETLTLPGGRVIRMAPSLASVDA